MSGAGRRATIKARLDVNGRLDQLEDRLSGTQEAGGSNPPASTIIQVRGPSSQCNAAAVHGLLRRPTGVPFVRRLHGFGRATAGSL